MADPRKNLPSASAFARYVVCPGSFALAASVPPEPESDDAASGTRIHAALAGAPGAAVEADEAESFDRCRDLERMFLLHAAGNRKPRELIREHRLWMPHPVTLHPVFSGQPDGVALFDPDPAFGGEELALVWDFKTLRGDVAPAEFNWQLRALAVLVAENFGVSNIVAAIIQPWVPPGITVAHYDPEDLATARTICLELALKVTKPGLPRVPTEQGCLYCPAKAFCPEATSTLPQLAAITLRPAPGEVVDASTIARLLPYCGLAKKVAAAVEARAREMLALDPDCLPGFRLEVGEPREKIADSAAVWDRLSEAHKVDAREFIAACSASKTAMKALVKKATGLRGRALDNALENLIEGCCKTGKAPVSLVKVE